MIATAHQASPKSYRNSTNWKFHCFRKKTRCFHDDFNIRQLPTVNNFDNGEYSVNRDRYKQSYF